MAEKQDPYSLAAEDFHHDPAVLEAKKQLMEALKTHQQKLTGVKPPDPLRTSHYQNLLANFYQMRGANLWFPFLGSGMGNGALVELLDGSVKYDFISGIGPHFFGHSHPDIIASSLDAAFSDTIMQGHLQQNQDTVQLCELLLSASGLDHCFLTTTGAMANENAFKIAFQKNFPATRVLAFNRCFAGRTLFLSQVTDKPSFREGLPSNVFVDYIPFYDAKNPEESIKESLRTLKQLLYRYPGQYALMCIELVQGEAGFYFGTPEFYRSLMHVLREHNIAILIDEIQTFARLPKLFAFQYFKLEEFADIITIGKASQVCATLYRSEYKPKPGLLSQTFTGSTSAIKASTVLIKKLLEGNFFGTNGKINNIHDHFSALLQDLADKYPHLIQGPFGIGGMIAFTPFGGEEKKVIDFVRALFDNGLMTFVAGSHPTRVRMLVPILALGESDVNNAMLIIEKTLLQFETH